MIEEYKYYIKEIRDGRLLWALGKVSMMCEQLEYYDLMNRIEEELIPLSHTDNRAKFYKVFKDIFSMKDSMDAFRLLTLTKRLSSRHTNIMHGLPREERTQLNALIADGFLHENGILGIVTYILSMEYYMVRTKDIREVFVVSLHAALNSEGNVADKKEVKMMKKEFKDFMNMSESEAIDEGLNLYLDDFERYFVNKNKNFKALFKLIREEKCYTGFCEFSCIDLMCNAIMTASVGFTKTNIDFGKCKVSKSGFKSLGVKVLDQGKEELIKFGVNPKVMSEPALILNTFYLISYLSKENKVPSKFLDIVSLLSSDDRPRTLRLAGYNMYTPDFYLTALAMLEICPTIFDNAKYTIDDVATMIFNFTDSSDSLSIGANASIVLSSQEIYIPEEGILASLGGREYYVYNHEYLGNNYIIVEGTINGLAYPMIIDRKEGLIYRLYTNETAIADVANIFGVQDKLICDVTKCGSIARVDTSVKEVLVLNKV